MIYELTDTNTEMSDAITGASLGFHPVFVIESDSPEAALQTWQEQHGKTTEGLTIREVG